MNVREKVSPVTPEELDLTIAILILGNHECGGMPFKQWFKTRLHSSINMFDSIGGLNSSDVKFLPYYRFMKILKFLCSGPISYVTRKIWKKSSAMAHRERGGFFVDGNTRTLDLDALFRPFIELFNANSKSVYKSSGWVCLDEILSKSKSRKNPIKMYNGGKKDKTGMLYHQLCDSKTGFLINTELRMTKQFLKPEHFKVSDLCLDFFREFEKSNVFVTMDNYFNSYPLTQICNEKKILVFGTIRKNVLKRFFDDHDNGLNGYIETKNSRNHNIKCFTASVYDHPSRGRVHVQIYNSPGHNSVLFITNSNSAVGKSDLNFIDHRNFLGGHYSRSLPETNSRPYTAKIYNDNMGGVDNYDVYLHKYTLRYIPLKHKLAWLLKPVLSVVDYQLLNCFFLSKEIRPSREKPDYRNFILRVAQGFCANSLKRSSAPLKVRNRSFSRSKCKSCHDIDPYKDSRTSKFCDRCNSATCSNHAKILCRQCFAS